MDQLVVNLPGEPGWSSNITSKRIDFAPATDASSQAFNFVLRQMFKCAPVITHHLIRNKSIDGRVTDEQLSYLQDN